MLLVQLGAQVEDAPLTLDRHSLRPFEIQQRCSAAPEGRALIRRRKESAAPILRPALAAGLVLENDESRQALILRTQAVRNPGARAGETHTNQTGVHLIHGRPVRGRLSPA